MGKETKLPYIQSLEKATLPELQSAIQAWEKLLNDKLEEIDKFKDLPGEQWRIKDSDVVISRYKDRIAVLKAAAADKFGKPNKFTPKMKREPVLDFYSNDKIKKGNYLARPYESLKSFKEFIAEKYLPIGNIGPHVSKVADDLSKMKGPLIYRKFTIKRKKGLKLTDILLVSALKDTSGDWFGIDSFLTALLKGYLIATVKYLVHDKLKIKYPVFCTSNKNNDIINNSDSFGPSYIVVARGKTEYFYSKDIKDVVISTDEYMHAVMKDDTIKSMTVKEAGDNMYKKYKKSSTPPSEIYDEIILDTMDYWLIPVSYLEKLYGKSKVAGLKTYQDLISLLESGTEKR